MAKFGYVAIVGRANVGKSSLINKMVGEKLSIVSQHPQTTRDNILGILTNKNGQIVFTDTPGMHRRINDLSLYMNKEVKKATAYADLCLYVIAADKAAETFDFEYLKRLYDQRQDTIVVLNKCDVAKGDKLIETAKLISNLGYNFEIVPTSARNGKGLDELINVVFSKLKDGEPEYPDDMYTDKSIRYLCSEIIREKAMQLLSEELPYGIAVVIDKFEEKEKIVEIQASLICERQTHKGMIIGKGAERIKKINIDSRYEIERILDQKVYLDLYVKVKSDWRSSQNKIKDLGYNLDD